MSRWAVEMAEALQQQTGSGGAGWQLAVCNRQHRQSADH